MNFLNLTTDDKELLTAIFQRSTFATSERLDTLFKVLEFAANHQRAETASREILHSVKEALTQYESLIEPLSQKYPGIENDASFRKLAVNSWSYVGMNFSFNELYFLACVQDNLLIANSFDEAAWAAEDSTCKGREELQERFFRCASNLEKLNRS